QHAARLERKHHALPALKRLLCLQCLVQPGGRSLRRQGSASSLPEFARSSGPDLDRRRQARVMSLQPTSRPRPEHPPPERPEAARRGTPDGHFPTKAPLDVALHTTARPLFPADWMGSSRFHRPKTTIQEYTHDYPKDRSCSFGRHHHG